MNNYVAIEGNIGAGKTTLSKRLAAKTNRHLILEEFEENEFLPLFYKEPLKYGLQVELSFLIDRINQLKSLSTHTDKTLGDYCIFKCLVFAQINLDHQSFLLFKKAFEALVTPAIIPDQILFISRKSETLLDNISKRGRNYETDINAQYLENIEAGYQKISLLNDNLAIISISSDNKDWIRDARYDNQIINLINQNFDAGVHHLKI